MEAILQDLLRELINYTYPALLLAFLLCLAYILAAEKGMGKKLLAFWRNRKPLILFLLYLAFLLMATVFGRNTTVPTRSVFKHLYFRPGDEKWNREILENLLVFIPLTFLYLNSFLKRPKRPWQYAFFVALSTSLFAELSQLIFWLGEFQFSDILYNTLGGLIGCGMWVLKDRLFRSRL